LSNEIVSSPSGLKRNPVGEINERCWIRQDDLHRTGLFLLARVLATQPQVLSSVSFPP
jgi:hypothetical protein